MSIVARLEKQCLDPQRELAALIEAAQGGGAVVSFVGLTRGQSAGGEVVDALVLQAHPRLTLRSLEQIAEGAAERFQVSDVRVVHRCGKMCPGEPIVFAGAAAPHRRAAFEAADYLMDRLKTEAVFWKREIGAAGPRWIEPTDADFSERERWG